MPRLPDQRLGVDVGGTNTDAVVIDPRGVVLASAKVPTSPNITDGVARAVAEVIAEPGVAGEAIGLAALGTTHAINALSQRSGLDRVAVVRISGPAGYAIPPLYGWPSDLREAVSVGEAIIDGGYEFDGRPIADFDAAHLRRFLQGLPESPAGIAITGVFAPMRPDQELAAASVVADVLGDVSVSLSHEVSGIGLIERENATVLNAALTGAAREALSGFEGALCAQGLNPRVLFAQNDGTLMSIDQALRTPVLTIGSGPANSLRGAASVTASGDALVIDVGGTTTDIGTLTNGLPRESYAGRVIGSVRTNFRVPDIITVPLGGGTVIRDLGGAVRLGPESVGHNLRREALVFGGETPTLTDAAVLAGRMTLGDVARLAPYATLLEAAIAESDRILADAVDQAKTSRAAATLIAVGGGRSLLSPQIAGIEVILSPEHSAIANAIGAANADIGAEAEAIVPVDQNRAGAVAALRRDALERAVGAGARPDQVEIVDIEETPLAYLTPPAIRYRIRAAGSTSL